MQPTRKRIMSISSCTSISQSEIAYRNYLEAAEKFKEARSPSPRSRYTQKMRIMTYDIWNGGLPVSDDLEDRLEKIVSVIRKHRPDVLCI